MKILVVAWRAWSAAHRYKSLMVNAKILGHEILGLASNRNKEAPLAAEAFSKIDVPCLQGHQVDITAELNRFQPDAVFGEYWLGELVKEEVESHCWAAQHGKPAFLLDHCQYWDYWDIKPPPTSFAQSVLLTVNNVRTTGAKVAGWKSVYTVGQPDFDLIQNSYDIPAIKREWGMPTEQPLIALFLGHIWGPAGSVGPRDLPHEESVMFGTAEFIQKLDWKIVAHCHAEERRGKTRIHFSQRVPFLQGLQNRGVTFIASWAPGPTEGIVFHPGCPYELIAASDAVIGSPYSIAMKCLAMERKYFWVYSPSVLIGDSANRVQEYEYFKGIASWASVGKGFKTLMDAVENRKNRCHLSKKASREKFYKLDGKCWRRMLDLAEELQ